MGNNTSKNELNQLTEIMNKQMTNISSEAQSDSTTTCVTSNVASVSYDGPINSCDVVTNINLESVVDCALNASSAFTNISDLQTKMKNAIDEEIKNSQSKTSGFLATAVGDKTENITNIQNKINNIVDTTITSKVVNDCALAVNVSNDGTLHFNKLDCTADKEAMYEAWKMAAELAYEHGKEPPSIKDFKTPNITSTIDSSIQAKAVGNCLSNALMSAIKKDESLNDLVLKTDVKQDVKGEGIDKLVDSIANGLTKIVDAFMGPYQNIIIVFLIVAAFVIYYFFKSGGMDVVSKAVDKAGGGGGVAGSL
jgi:hypothetical protein